MNGRKLDPRKRITPPAEQADPLADLTSPAAIDALVHAGADLLQPTNRSPGEVVQDLVAGEQDWQALEQRDVLVRHSLEHGRTKIELVLTDDRNLPKAIELHINPAAAV